MQLKININDKIIYHYTRDFLMLYKQHFLSNNIFYSNLLAQSAPPIVGQSTAIFSNKSIVIAQYTISNFMITKCVLGIGH